MTAPIIGPQVYYVGLLAGENDMTLLAQSGVGRDINRHCFMPDEIDRAIQRPVVQSLFELIHFRNRHPAFNGSFSLPETRDSGITLRWDNGVDWAMLEVDFASGSYSISNSPFKLIPLEARSNSRIGSNEEPRRSAESALGSRPG